MPVKRMAGSSRLKLEQKKEQRILRMNRNWRGMMESYSAEETLHGTAIVISQPKFAREGSIVFRPWTDEKMRGRLSNPVLAFMQKGDLLLISKSYHIPLRIVERLQRRERENIVKAYDVIVEGPNPGVLLRLKGEVYEAKIKPALLPNGKPKPFENYSGKDLESICAQTGIPFPLLELLRQRERERILRAKSLVGNMKKEMN